MLWTELRLENHVDRMMKSTTTQTTKMALLLVLGGMCLLVVGDLILSALVLTPDSTIYKSFLRLVLGIVLFVFLIRSGNGKASGATRLVTTRKKYWWAAFLPLSFFLLANFSSQDWSALNYTAPSVLTWITNNASVGFVEEALYRGIGLFLLLHAWGKTRSGLLAAIGVQAIIFGSFHVLNLLSGAPVLPVLVNSAFAMIVGFGFGAAYAYSGSLWTCIFLHTAIDMAGSANDALGVMDQVKEQSMSMSSFIPSMVVVIIFSLLPAFWFACRSELRQGSNDLSETGAT